MISLNTFAARVTRNHAWVTIFVPLCNSITRQSIVLESCSNPKKMWQVCMSAMKKSILVLLFFVSDVISSWVLAILAQVTWRWAQPQAGNISLKFLLETRLESESFEPLIGFLTFLVQKLWANNNKILSKPNQQGCHCWNMQDHTFAFCRQFGAACIFWERSSVRIWLVFSCVIPCGN